MKDSFVDYLKVTSAARMKNISRSAILLAAARGKIDVRMIDGTPHIIKNDKFYNWTPREKKDATE